MASLSKITPALLLLVLVSSPLSEATTFIDDFSESPAASGEWCEVLLAVGWREDTPGSGYLEGVNASCCVDGDPGTIDCNPNACTLFTGESSPCEPCAYPTNANLCEHLLITQYDYAGEDRSVSVQLEFQGDPLLDSSGPIPNCTQVEHVKVVAAAHPECEARIEARLHRQTGDNYQVDIRLLSSPRAGYPECEALDEVVATSPVFGLLPGEPRYELTLDVSPSTENPATELQATAQVIYDFGVSTLVMGEASTDSFTRPAWYDQAGQGRRFGIGGAREGMSAPTILDDFVGVAVPTPSPTPAPTPTPSVCGNDTAEGDEGCDGTDLRGYTCVGLGFTGGTLSCRTNCTALVSDDCTLPGSPPADPSTNAPANDPTTPTEFGSSVSFLYSGPNRVQYGVADGVIDPEQAAVVSGYVGDGTGTAVELVEIRVLDRPEYGATVSRADGRFDLVVNGGGPVTMVYSKMGFLVAHRRVEPRWGEGVEAPDVHLVPRDIAETPVTFPIVAPEGHKGTEQTDVDGSRSARIVLLPGTDAELVFIDESGSETTVPLTNATVRATEYTVGASGPERMPAELPAFTAYTYAVELEIDEAVVAGADRVDFFDGSGPVDAFFYVEDFVGVWDSPTGGADVQVPVGFYDRLLGEWVPAASGQVVRVLSVGGSPLRAEIDTDGDGSPDNAGISADEREGLAATLTTVPVNLWRVPIPHFSTVDCNFPHKGPPGAGGGGGGGDNEGDDGECGDTSSGSIIECQPQVLGESIGVVGTARTLNYRSDRVPGRDAARSLMIDLHGENPPTTVDLDRIDLEVLVAGHAFPYSVDVPGGVIPPTFPFTDWDGTDAFGRTVQGRVPATIRIGYVYDANYARTEEFGDLPGTSIGVNRDSRQLTYWREFESFVENWDARGWGIGGWTFDVHHLYDPGSGVLLRGDGGRRTEGGVARVVDTVSSGHTFPAGLAVDRDGRVYIGENNRVLRLDSDGTVTRVAGKGTAEGFNGDGPADALTLTLGKPFGLAFAPNGDLYIADADHHRVRRLYLSINGVLEMETVAGSGACSPSCSGGYSGDGGPATMAELNSPFGVSVGPDGALYIGDTNNHCIRRVDLNGTIETIAGTCGTPGSSPDNDTTLAKDALLREPVALDFDDAGNLYVALRGGGSEARIRRIRTDGFIETIAGVEGISNSDPADGSEAATTAIGEPRTVTVAGDGSVFFADRVPGSAWLVVRQVTPGGILNTIAGSGVDDFSGDGGPAKLATFRDISGTALAPDGSLYIADSNNNRVRRVASTFPSSGGSASEILIGSADGRRIFVFDALGRHDRTLDALTHGELFSFDYDGSGRLEKITERSVHETLIVWPSGGPGTITGPGGQVNTFTFDANAYLQTLTNEAGDEVHTLTHDSEGLLTDMTDPRGNASIPVYSWAFAYDSMGRLTSDADPEVLLEDASETYKTLVRTDNSVDQYEVDLQTTVELNPAPERRTTTYSVLQSADGMMVRETTFPDGTKRVLEIRADDTRFLTEPDETETLVTRGPDPRFGMIAPVAEQVVVTTPGDLETVVTETRTATPADPSQPLEDWQRTITIHGIGGGDDRTYTIAYDSDGGPGGSPALTETSPMGRVRRTFLDGDGRVVGSEIEGLEEVSLEYPTGLLEWIRQGPSDEREIGLTYDSDLRMETITRRISSIPDVTETVTFGTFDGGNRPELVTLPNSDVVGLTYDENGNVRTLTPPGKLTPHEFQYNRVNLEEFYIPPPVPLVSDPSVNSATNTETDYDFARELDVQTRPGGGQVDRDFDAVTGQLTTITLPAGEGALEYAYDEDTGQVKTIIGPEPGTNRQALEFEYDGFLRTSTWWTCESELDPLWTDPCEPGTVEATVSEVYDDNFRRVSQTVGGVAVTFDYDKDDLLQMAGSLAIDRAPAPATPTEPLHPDFSHGGITGSALGAVEDTYSYNRFGEIDAYTAVQTFSGPPELFAATYPDRDGLGRITRKTERLQEGPLHEYTYQYDSRGRLDLVTITENGNPFGTEDYEYDANGNRLLAPNLSGPTEVEYDDQDRLCVYEGTTYLYTENGELLRKTENATGTIGCAEPGMGDATEYEYDALGNLREVTFPDGTTVQYLVDGLGRRIGKQVWNDVSEEFEFKQGFVYESQLRIVAELDENGAIKSRFVYGDRANVPEYMVQGSDTYRIVTDYLGSVRLVVNAANGAVVQRMEYDSFGRVLVDTSPGFQPFGFAGGLYDVSLATLPGTEFVRFGARDYDPEVGRWVAKDPKRFAGGDTNLYEYAASDPVNFSDPPGEKAKEVAAVLAICALVKFGMFADGALDLGEGAEEIGRLNDQVDHIDELLRDPDLCPTEEARLIEMREELRRKAVKIGRDLTEAQESLGEDSMVEVLCSAALAAAVSPLFD